MSASEFPMFCYRGRQPAHSTLTLVELRASAKSETALFQPDELYDSEFGKSTINMAVK